jgi:cytochrome c oxidase subunit 2
MELFFPEQASTFAHKVDALYAFMVALSAVVSFGIFAAIAYFAFRYARKSEHEVGVEVEGSILMEVAWLGIPLIVFLFIFGWSAKLFMEIARPPKDATDIYVTGRQWMWKVQHLDGHREINHLHVPTGKPFRLVMTSEDVIHSFYVPAFRQKQDVVPGRYSHMWFQATRPGTYHLFCAEYCGTKHSGMIGKIVVMEPADYLRWRSGGTGGSLAGQGEQIFHQFNCHTCHNRDAGARGPNLENIFGKPVVLEGGAQVIVDESYVRESILNPTAKIVKGFQPLMPTFAGQVSEEQIVELIAYIKSLTKEEKKPDADPKSGQGGKKGEDY